MSRTSFGLVLTSLLMVSGSAFADSFTFTSAGNVTWDNVYVNPYQATDNTQTQNNPLTIYCDDFNTDFTGNPTWNAGVYALTASNVQNFKYGNITSNYSVSLSGSQLNYAQVSTPSAFNLYLEAAYMDQQLAGVLASGASAATKQNAQIEYSAAQWTLFINSANVSGLVGAINSSGDASDVSGYLTAAQNAVAGGFNAAGWDVIVPTNNTFAMQEFLVHGLDQTSVPEPSAVILLGSIIGLLGLKFRRKQQA